MKVTWQTPRSWTYDVFLDGVQQDTTAMREADEENGRIVFMLTEDNGAGQRVPALHPVTRQLMLEEKTGKVEIRERKP